jgi:hypothetical protein
MSEVSEVVVEVSGTDGAVRGRSAWRRRFTDSAAQSALAALPRRGRVITQCTRAFLAHHPDPVTMTTLRQWCFAGRPRQHWQYWSITRALRRLNAASLGRAGRAGIWSLSDQ